MKVMKDYHDLVFIKLLIIPIYSPYTNTQKS